MPLPPTDSLGAVPDVLGAPAVPPAAVAAAPPPLRAQVVDRFAARVSADPGVSAAAACALCGLLADGAAPSRDAILRAVRSAVEVASLSAGLSAAEDPPAHGPGRSAEHTA